MALQLQPADVLTFKRPFTRTSKEILSLRNPTNEDIAFKVKTTAPKLYCVRPNAGIVNGGGTMEVQVMLQPFKEEPPLEQRSKDKFLVQTVVIKDDLKHLQLTELWPQVERSAKESIQQFKLNCRFVEEGDTKTSMERSASESTVVSNQKTEFEQPASVVENGDDAIAKLRMELDNYKNELEALRCRPPPDTAVVGSKKVSQLGVSYYVVAAVAVLSMVISFLLFRQ